MNYFRVFIILCCAQSLMCPSPLWAQGPEAIAHAQHSEYWPQLMVKTSQQEVAATGFVQTPLGGRVGTSSIKRPTLAELGINRLILRQHSWLWPHGAYGVYWGRHVIQANGQNALTRPLLTYATSFKANERIESKLAFNWWQIGSLYTLALIKDKLIVAPKVELAILDFFYQFLSPPPAQSKRRAYRHLSLRVGGAVTYHYANNVFISAEAMFSPMFNQLHINNAMMKLNFKLRNGVCAIGMQILRINYIDGQNLPNHLYFNTHLVPVVRCDSH